MSDPLREYGEAFHEYVATPEGNEWASKNSLVLIYVELLESRLKRERMESTNVEQTKNADNGASA